MPEQSGKKLRTLCENHIYCIFFCAVVHQTVTNRACHYYEHFLFIHTSKMFQQIAYIMLPPSKNKIFEKPPFTILIILQALTTCVFLSAKIYLCIPRTSSSVRPFLADGCAPDWRTTEPKPSSSSLSRPANFGSNAERQRSSLGEEKQRLVFCSCLQNHLGTQTPLSKASGKSTLKYLSIFCNAVVIFIDRNSFSQSFSSFFLFNFNSQRVFSLNYKYTKVLTDSNLKYVLNSNFMFAGSFC